MTIEAMKQALEALEQINQLSVGENAIALPGEIDAAMDNLRAAIEQAEKPMAWFHADNYKTRFTTDPSEELFGKDWKPLYTVPRQEQYDQTSLELCEECSWKALIPGDGCLICARQKAKPVAYTYTGIRQDGSTHGPHLVWKPEYMDAMSASKGAVAIPLYTAPRQWVGLTDEEYQIIHSKNYNYEELALAVEAKLKEKNHEYRSDEASIRGARDISSV